MAMFRMIVGATLVPIGYEFLRTKNGVSLRINESGDLLSKLRRSEGCGVL
jgi:hypothetical protein